MTLDGRDPGNPGHGDSGERQPAIEFPHGFAPSFGSLLLIEDHPKPLPGQQSTKTEHNSEAGGEIFHRPLQEEEAGSSKDSSLGSPPSAISISFNSASAASSIFASVPRITTETPKCRCRMAG